MKRLLASWFTILAIGCATAPPRPDLTEQPRVQRLLADPKILAAMNDLDRQRDAIVEEWMVLTAINAPSGHEAERAAAVEARLRTFQLDRVERDSAGNLIAYRKGSGGGPTVVIDAHLDTVFQPGLQITPMVKDGRMAAPGVGDDTRNLVAMLAMIRALDAAGIRTKGDLIFSFTVEEETTFRGIDQFLSDHKDDIDHFIALDGGYEGFTYGGIGTNWYRHHFLGAGGHTRSRTPPWSATLPVARSIARIAKLRVPKDPPTNLNVGMIGGGEVVNAKAADAWFTVDLRSTDERAKERLAAKIEAILREEARRSGTTLKTEVISAEKAAQIPGHRQSLLVRTAEAVYAALGFKNPDISPTASNHASPALRLGIPAISTGTAPCSGAHSLAESCEIEPIVRGTKKIMLLALAMSGVEP